MEREPFPSKAFLTVFRRSQFVVNLDKKLPPSHATTGRDGGVDSPDGAGKSRSGGLGTTLANGSVQSIGEESTTGRNAGAIQVNDVQHFAR